MNNIKYLTKPLTIEKIYDEIDDENTYIEDNICIDLHTIIDNDLEGFLDIISEKLVGSPLLMDVSYSVVGTTEDGDIILKVSGDVSDIIRMYEI